MTISIETRNSEDTSWTSVGSFSAITATGASSVDFADIKEIVRFVYDFDGADQATDGMHFLMMAPSWRPY